MDTSVWISIVALVGGAVVAIFAVAYRLRMNIRIRALKSEIEFRGMTLGPSSSAEEIGLMVEKVRKAKRATAREGGADGGG